MHACSDPSRDQLSTSVPRKILHSFLPAWSPWILQLIECVKSWPYTIYTLHRTSAWSRPNAMIVEVYLRTTVFSSWLRMTWSEQIIPSMIVYSYHSFPGGPSRWWKLIVAVQARKFVVWGFQTTWTTKTLMNKWEFYLLDLRDIYSGRGMRTWWTMKSIQKELHTWIVGYVLATIR